MSTRFTAQALEALRKLEDMAADHAMSRGDSNFAANAAAIIRAALEGVGEPVGWRCTDENCAALNSLEDGPRCWRCDEYHGSGDHQLPVFLAGHPNQQ